MILATAARLSRGSRRRAGRTFGRGAWLLDRDMDEAAHGIEEGRVGPAPSGHCGVTLPVAVSRSTRAAERTDPWCNDWPDFSAITGNLARSIGENRLGVLSVVIRH
jgi:hypothetical protein